MRSVDTRRLKDQAGNEIGLELLIDRRRVTFDALRDLRCFATRREIATEENVAVRREPLECGLSTWARRT